MWQFIALHGVDQVGDEIVPLLHLHVDVGQGPVDALEHRNEAVVDNDGPQGEKDEYSGENPVGRRHGVS
jgi:hypothetical protein